MRRHTFTGRGDFWLTSRSFFLLTISFALFGCGWGNDAPRVGASHSEAVYIAPTSGGQILIFSFDSSTGVMTNQPAVAGPSTASDLKADSAGKFLYASDLSSGLVYAYSIDAATGGLSPLGDSPFPFPGGQAASGFALAVDPAGNFLFYLGTQGMTPPLNNQGMIAQFTINHENGALTPGSGQVVSDTNGPNQIAVDPSGRFLYVANFNNQCGDDYSAYSIDPGTGSLTSISGSPFTFIPNSRPYGLALMNSGTFLFSSLSNRGVAAMSIDSTTGNLKLVPGSPFTAGSVPQSLALHPSGRFLYVRDSGNNSISEFSVDTTTGVLTPLDGSPFADGNDGEIAIDASGQFLFDLGVSQQQIAILRIDQATGALTTGDVSALPAINNTNAMAVVALP